MNQVENPAKDDDEASEATSDDASQGASIEDPIGDEDEEHEEQEVNPSTKCLLRMIRPASKSKSKSQHKNPEDLLALLLSEPAIHKLKPSTWYSS